MRSIAILATDSEAYSETFIQAHKKLRYRIHFYYGDVIPTTLEGSGPLMGNIKNLYYLIARRFSNSIFSANEMALKASLKKKKVECVLAEYGVVAAECLNVVKSLNLPLIVHFHGFDASEYRVLKEYGYRYKELFKYASSVIAVSKKMIRDLIALGCPEEKITLNTYGPNDRFFSIRFSGKKKQFVSAGRFVDKKAPYLTLEAFRIVLQHYPAAHLLMAGAGPLLNTCKNLVRIWNMKDNVTFLGIVSPEEIMNIFSESLAFVQHSIVADNGDSEGTPVVLIEAGAAGMPVVATKHAGIPDLVDHGVNGYLVDEYDIEGMAECMIKVIENPDEARTMGERLSLKIKENYTMEKHLQVISKEIEKAIVSRS